MNILKRKNPEGVARFLVRMGTYSDEQITRAVTREGVDESTARTIVQEALASERERRDQQEV